MNLRHVGLGAFYLDLSQKLVRCPFYYYYFFKTPIFIIFLEENELKAIELGVIDILINLMKTHNEDPKLCANACRVLTNITHDGTIN